jgi:hypothetical protein
MVLSSTVQVRWIVRGTQGEIGEGRKRFGGGLGADSELQGGSRFWGDRKGEPRIRSRSAPRPLLVWPPSGSSANLPTILNHSRESFWQDTAPGKGWR